MKTKSEENIYTLFPDWLKQNEDRLSVPLLRTPYKKGKIYSFKGISNDLLSLQISEGGIIIWVYYDGVAVEMLYVRDAVSGFKRGKGYYCISCSEPEYYSSLKEFYIQHCFEKLLKWINNKLVVSKYIDISFFGDRDGTSTADLDIDIIHKKKVTSAIKSISKMKVENIRVTLWN